MVKYDWMYSWFIGPEPTATIESPDDFIIGDRVFVGGTKPGNIAFIGETRFAPGEWAGVVLDRPVGKNDGSVAGVRYFQCAAQHGVFSRIAKLTRKLVTASESGMRPPGSKSSLQRGPISGSMQSLTGGVNGNKPSPTSSVSSLSMAPPAQLPIKVCRGISYFEASALDFLYNL